MKNSYFIALALFAGLCTPVLAQKYGVNFQHKYWEVVCDNGEPGGLTEQNASGFCRYL